MCRQLVCWPCLFVMLYLHAQLSQSLHTVQIVAFVLPFSTWIQREHLSQQLCQQAIGTYIKLAYPLENFIIFVILNSENGTVVFTAYAQTCHARITICTIDLDFCFSMSRIYHFIANFLKLYFASDTCLLVLFIGTKSSLKFMQTNSSFFLEG